MKQMVWWAGGCRGEFSPPQKAPKVSVKVSKVSCMPKGFLLIGSFYFPPKLNEVYITVPNSQMKKKKT